MRTEPVDTLPAPSANRRKRGRAPALPRGIERLPSGMYRARVRHGGVSTSRAFELLRDAVGWQTKTRREVDERVWAPDDASTSTTLASALDRYQREVVPTMRGIRGESSIVRILRDQPEASQTLGAITSETIARIRDRWLRAGYKAGSVQRRFHTLSHLFTTAQKEWGMPRLGNPVRGLSMPRADDARSRRVSDAELGAIRAAGVRTRHLPDFVTLAVETAARCGELVRVQWRDVDTDAGTLFVRKSKNGHARTVPLSPRAVAVLRTMGRRHDGQVFAWKRPDSASQAFARAVKRARKAYEAKCKAEGVRPDPAFLMNLRLHDLRHEAISRLAPLFEVHELARITGHETLGMLMRYYHPSAENFARRLAAAVAAGKL